MRERERSKGTYSPEEADYEVFDLDQIEARNVRLNDEGELTDSFIQESNDGHQEQRR